MNRIYFGTKYEWANKKHEEARTRAYLLFKYGRFTIGKKTLEVEPYHIELWLKKKLIKEVKKNA